jgi:phosphoserine aminotransferase
MVCDMSSDIFSRQLDFSKFDLIYAGAQKIWDLQELL